ncbi:YcgJ family protein [Cyanobium sp. NS01]|uniref:YcgJ family protein n=1 Tax=Cyanobium sp. NS01 TaxID=261284 RepID=UPI0016449678|nr:YcgJ family protein [Cyanobium sp. NS01]
MTVRSLSLRLSSTAAVAAASAGLGLLAGAAPAAAMPRWLSSPEAGVVCDQRAQTCFSSKGVSLEETRRQFGSQAARRLQTSLIGRPVPQEFQLTDGSLCSLRAETCWERGSDRQRVERELTRVLFGRVSRNDREVTTYEGRCTLAQGSRLLHDGDCSLRLVERSNGVTRYVVTQPDGRRFNFSDRSGRLEVRDATGTSPVTFIDHGYTGVFRWRNLTLVATRENRGLRRGRSSSDGIGELFSDR